MFIFRWFTLSFRVFFQECPQFQIGCQPPRFKWFFIITLRSKIKPIHQLWLYTKWKEKECVGLKDMGISELCRFIFSRSYSSVVLGLKNLVASIGPFTMAVSCLGLFSWAGEWQFLSHQIIWYLIQGGTTQKIIFSSSEGKGFCIYIHNTHLKWLSARKLQISSTDLMLLWHLPSPSLTLDKSSTWQLITKFSNLQNPKLPWILV